MLMSLTFSRLPRIQAGAAGQADAVLLAAGDDCLYALGYTPPGDERVTFLVIGARGTALVVPGVNATEAHQRLDRSPVAVYDYADDQGPAAALRQALQTAAGRTAGGTVLISDAARHDHVRAVQAALAPDVVDLAGRVIRPLRMVKDADEVAALRASAAAADEAFRRGIAAVRPGVTERAVHDVMLQAFRDLGGDGLSFQAVAFGPHTAVPHHHPEDTPIGRGALWFDLGCRKDGYCSDLTRPAYVGEPDAEYRRIHAIVLEARLAGEAAARAGNPASAVDRAARDVIERAGYGPYFVHRTGHGIGVSVHEPPFMMAGDETILEPGMAFSIEPGIYLPGRFGVRIEDIAVVTDGDPEILSALPRDPVLLND
jgi:Xaa-Pro aminopeptidase